jgi:hypothetical protein
VAWEVRPLKTLLLAPLFLVVASAGDRLAIHLHNQAGASHPILDGAIHEARRILARAGVETAWIEAPSDAPEARRFQLSARQPSAQAPDTRGYLVVIVGRGGSAFQDTVGFALPGAHVGVHAVVLYNRLLQIFEPALVSPQKALGWALAHEVGHVLLGSPDHSPTGLMKGHWDRLDAMRAEAGILEFSRSEGEIMREHAGARLLRAPLAPEALNQH